MLAMLGVASAAHAQAAPSPYTSASRYDGGRHLVGTIAPDPDVGGPLHYAAVRDTYDGDERLIRVEKGELSGWQSEAVAPASWTGFTVFQTTDISYDATWRKVKEVVSAGGTIYGVTQYSYDGDGRAECTALRMNAAAFASPPSSACTLGTAGADGPDRITRNVYDAADELVTVQKAYGTAIQQNYAGYTYSNNGKQVSVTDANGNKASLTYDGFDRLAQWNFPSPTTAGTVSATDYEAYGYDPAGNRTSLRKRDGQVIGYTYDALNRVTLKDIPGGTTADVYYGYDLRGLQLYARFGSASGQGVTTAYDSAGRRVSSTTNVWGTALSLAYQYDADGDRIRVTHPDGAYFAYGYDGLDRAVSIGEGATVVATIAYDAQGHRAGLTRSGAGSTAYGYDGVSRLASLTNDLAGTGADVGWGYGYNAASQATSRSSSNAAYNFTGNYAVTRPYAANGLNQYQTAGPATFSYDARGNLTSDGSTTFGYDVENRLVAASGSRSASLSYDPLGRLWQTSGGAPGIVRFLYDGDSGVAKWGLSVRHPCRCRWRLSG